MPNKTVLDNRLPAPSLNAYRDYNPAPPLSEARAPVPMQANRRGGPPPGVLQDFGGSVR